MVEKALFLWWQAGHYIAWVRPSEITCHLHILVMSGELATGVDLYTLIALIQCSETKPKLDIMQPCYGEPCMSSTTPWTQSALVWATNEVDEGLGWYVHIDDDVLGQVWHNSYYLVFPWCSGWMINALTAEPLQLSSVFYLYLVHLLWDGIMGSNPGDNIADLCITIICCI